MRPWLSFSTPTSPALLPTIESTGFHHYKVSVKQPHFPASLPSVVHVKELWGQELFQSLRCTVKKWGFLPKKKKREMQLEGLEVVLMESIFVFISPCYTHTHTHTQPETMAFSLVFLDPFMCISVPALIQGLLHGPASGQTIPRSSSLGTGISACAVDSLHSRSTSGQSHLIVPLTCYPALTQPPTPLILLKTEPLSMEAV